MAKPRHKPYIYRMLGRFCPSGSLPLVAVGSIGKRLMAAILTLQTLLLLGSLITKIAAKMIFHQKFLWLTSPEATGCYEDRLAKLIVTPAWRRYFKPLVCLAVC